MLDLRRIFSGGSVLTSWLSHLAFLHSPGKNSFLLLKQQDPMSTFPSTPLGKVGKTELEVGVVDFGFCKGPTKNAAD
jgi:hypothetical protein